MKIYQRFRDQRRASPDASFLHAPLQACSRYANKPVTFSYEQAGIEIEAMKKILVTSGIGPHHRVSLALDNRADFFLVFLALNALDASVVPLNMELSPRELGHIIGHSDTTLLIALPEHAAKLKEAMTIEELDVAILAYPMDPSVTTKLEGGREIFTDTAVVYTSGTTGPPKGCLLSETYFTYTGEWYAELGGYCQLTPGRERILTPLPTSHVNALVFTFMATLTTGGCLIQLDRFHPKTWWQTVIDSKATALHYLGVMPAILLGLPKNTQEDFSEQIKFGFGAGVEPEHHREFEKRFGFPLVEGWAMTETGAAGCFMVTHEPRHVGTRCIGRPTSNIDYRVIDGLGSDVEPGKPGEFLLRGSGENPKHGFFSGYYKDDQSTIEAWANGWLHTGDIVRADQEGSLFFVERKKNIIRRSGENIAITDIENNLLQHPAVSSCAVAPVPDQIRGEEVFALIVAGKHFPKNKELAESITEFCLERMTYFKAPGFIAFLDRIPITETQKIRRADTKKLARELLVTGKMFDLRRKKQRR